MSVHGSRPLDDDNSKKINPNPLFWTVLVLAFALRVAGIGFGLPLLVHNDEPIVVNHAMAYGLGDLNPHFFMIPPLTSYLLFIFYGMAYIAGLVLGAFKDPSDFLNMFLLDPTFFYLSGRLLIGVLPGVACVWALYRFSRAVFDEKIALYASLLLSVCYLHVQQSHYIYTDGLLTLWILLGARQLYLYCVNIEGDSAKQHAIWGGVYCGLACATKYTAGLFGIAWLLTHAVMVMLHNQDLRNHTFSWINKATIWFGCVSLLVYVLCNPFSILDWNTFITQFKNQAVVDSALAFPWYHHWAYSLFYGAGLLVVAFGVIGMVYSLFDRERISARISVVLFPVLFIAVSTFFSQGHERRVLPFIPYLCMFAVWISHEFSSKLKNRTRTICFGAMIVLMMLPNVVRAVYSDVLLMRQDTRLQTQAWIEKNIPAKVNIAQSHTDYGPCLWRTKVQLQSLQDSLRQKPGVSKAKKMRIEKLIELEHGHPTYNVYYLASSNEPSDQFALGSTDLPFDLKALQQKGIKYLVWHPDRASHAKKEMKMMGEELQRSAKKIATFSPYRDSEKIKSTVIQTPTAATFYPKELFSRTYEGPYLEIYQLPELQS